MATIEKMRRYLPARNLEAINGDSMADVLIKQDRGGVFDAEAFQITYDAGLEKCLVQIETIEGVDIFTSPMYLSDVGVKRGESENRMWSIEGVTLVSGNDLKATLVGNGTLIPEGAVSFFFLGNYSSDGG